MSVYCHKQFTFFFCCTLVCCVVFLLSGCQPKVKDTQSHVIRTIVDDSAAMQACMNRCAQDDELGKRTRKGCVKGCEMAREYAPFYEERYWRAEDCTNALTELDRQIIAQQMWKTCQEEWNHLYKRIGCRDAMRTYYAAIGTNMCVAEQPEMKDKAKAAEHSSASVKNDSNEPAAASSEPTDSTGTAANFRPAAPSDG